VVADPPVRNRSPNVLHSITDCLIPSLTVQAYDRPALFADDPSIQQRRSTEPSMGHKRNPTMPVSSRHRSRSSSGSTRKGSRKRSASFSDFVPPHLIARATTDSPPELPAPIARTPLRGGTIKLKSAPPSPPAYGNEKKSTSLRSPTDTDTDTLLSSLPTLSASPPPLPPKDYPVSSPQQKRQQSSGETCMPHVAMRLTAHVRGRTLGAVKSGERSSKGQSGDEEWIIV
jgi:hypothetical protein